MKTDEMHSILEIVGIRIKNRMNRISPLHAIARTHQSIHRSIDRERIITCKEDDTPETFEIELKGHACTIDWEII
jgi:hypothetical protein